MSDGGKDIFEVVIYRDTLGSWDAYASKNESGKARNFLKITICNCLPIVWPEVQKVVEPGITNAYIRLEVKHKVWRFGRLKVLGVLEGLEVFEVFEFLRF